MAGTSGLNIPQSQPQPSTSSGVARTRRNLQPEYVEPPPCPFPIASWKSTDSELLDIMLTGATLGVTLLTDLNVDIPLVGIRETFCRLYGDPDLVHKQLKKLHPLRGPFKNNGYLEKKHIDQKAVLDLSSVQIQEIQKRNIDLSPEFGQSVLPFYRRVCHEIIPRLKYLASLVISGGERIDPNYRNRTANHIMEIHSENNIKFRLVDFYPIHKTKTRCGEHRDLGTFTLIFQDKLQGGLEILTDDKKWIPVPTEREIVFMWGWSALVLSNNRIKAPCHRVVPIRINNYKKAARRMEAVFYVAPDWNALLHPTLIYPNETLQFKADSVKNLTLRDFKNLFEMRWHKREGTMTEEEKNLLTAISTDTKRIPGNTQDDDILDFLLGISSQLP